MSTPIELASAPRWVCWRRQHDPKGGNPRKVPYDPKTGRKASSTNPTTWTTMAEAQAALEKYNYSGIGYVFVEEAGIVGVDIDHCIDDAGNLNDCAKEIVTRFPTYTELSPSGTGLHLFYHGTMPGKRTRNSTTGVEMYVTARYFTMTGKQYPGSPDDIRDGSEALAWIHETYIAMEKKKPGRKSQFRVVELSDEEVMSIACAANNSDEFKSLYDGQWEGRFGSQSEADLSLCCSLAFWSGKNREQMDRLFRASKLFRPKWDEVHDAGGATYGQKTLDLALEKTDKVYHPGINTGIYEAGGHYNRSRGEESYCISNFIVDPQDMLEADAETQLICDLVDENGPRYHCKLSTIELSTAQKLKVFLARHTFGLSFFGSDNDLEMWKVFLGRLDWNRKKGVKASGLYEEDGHWIFVDSTGAFMAGGEPVDDIIQIESDGIRSNILESEPATAEDMQRIGPLLMGYNEPAKTVTVLAWLCGCFVKEILRSVKIKTPHLYMIGEAGSGKSTTMTRIIQPFFGWQGDTVSAPRVTSFTLLKDSSSSNLFPQLLDEFKPSKFDKLHLGLLLNHFRSVYDCSVSKRGRPDQTQISYRLMAPLVLCGEESPDETATRERTLQLIFSKKDLRNPEVRNAFRQISQEARTLTKVGRLLLDTVLTLNTETVCQWYNEALGMFEQETDERIVCNMSSCFAGLRVMEVALQRLGLTWSQVYPIPLDRCAKWMEYAASEYLLDGKKKNTSAVERTLEIMDRMGLNDEVCKVLEDGTVAIRFKGFYDRFTRYIKENGIVAEILPFEQFMSQLRRTEMYLETRTVRFAGGDPKSATILDFDMIKERCNVEGFIQAQIPPL